MTIQRTAAFFNRAVTPCMRVIAFAGGCGLMFMMVLVACKGAIPFLMADLIQVVVMTIFPQIILFLPTMMM